MKCKNCKEIIIKIDTNTSEERLETFKLCFSSYLIVIRNEGCLLRYCIYDEDNEIECPFKSG